MGRPKVPRHVGDILAPDRERMAAIYADAARYRWIRKSAYKSGCHICINADANPDDIKTVDDFDAMVDAELRAEPPSQFSNKD